MILWTFTIVVSEAQSYKSYGTQTKGSVLCYSLLHNGIGFEKQATNAEVLTEFFQARCSDLQAAFMGERADMAHRT